MNKCLIIKKSCYRQGGREKEVGVKRNCEKRVGRVVS